MNSVQAMAGAVGGLWEALAKNRQSVFFALCVMAIIGSAARGFAQDSATHDVDLGQAVESSKPEALPPLSKAGDKGTAEEKGRPNEHFREMPEATARGSKSLGPALKKPKETQILIRTSKEQDGSVSPVRFSRGLKLTDPKVFGAELDGLGDPTIAALKKRVFVTGNTYAAFSVDSGNTFSPLDPKRHFIDTRPAAIPKQEIFCCDQFALSIPSIDSIVWLMQGWAWTNGEGNNRIRVALTQGAFDASKALRFSYFDIVSSLGFSAGKSCPGCWYDFPDMAVTNGHLYLSFFFVRKHVEGSVVMRIKLSDLTARRSLWQFRYFNTFSPIKFMRGAGDTMIFGAHDFTSTYPQLAVWRWADADHEASAKMTVHVEPWTWYQNTSDPQGCSPDPQKKWATDSTSQLSAVWRSKKSVGFAWTAAPDDRFLCPHVRVALIPEQDLMALPVRPILKPSAEPHIWNEHLSLSHISVQPNSSGLVGAIMTFGGNLGVDKYWPSQAVGFLESTPHGSDLGNYHWRFRSVTIGESTLMPAIGADNIDQNIGRWGDYFTVIRDPANQKHWRTLTLTLQKKVNTADYEPVPQIVNFWRQGD